MAVVWIEEAVVLALHEERLNKGRIRGLDQG